MICRQLPHSSCTPLCTRHSVSQTGTVASIEQARCTTWLHVTQDEAWRCCPQEGSRLPLATFSFVHDIARTRVDLLYLLYAPSTNLHSTFRHIHSRPPLDTLLYMRNR